MIETVRKYQGFQVNTINNNFEASMKNNMVSSSMSAWQEG